MSDSAPVVSLLHDGSELWPRTSALLAGHVEIVHDGAVDPATTIGIVIWQRADREELAELPALRERHPGRILALLAELPSVRGARALSSSLEGSVLESELDRSLLPTVAAVHAGQCVMPSTVRALLVHPRLTPRERQVLALVVLGFTNDEAARRLHVSISAVKNHLTSSYAKLGVTSRQEASELILDPDSGLGPGILRISPD